MMAVTNLLQRVRRKLMPPEVALLEMLSYNAVSRSVIVAIHLGIADQLVAGPRSVADLAAATQANPDGLHRMLRALASVGVFAERADGSYALTPMAEALRADRPGIVRGI